MVIGNQMQIPITTLQGFGGKKMSEEEVTEERLGYFNNEEVWIWYDEEN